MTRVSVWAAQNGFWIWCESFKGFLTFMKVKSYSASSATHWHPPTTGALSVTWPLPWASPPTTPFGAKCACSSGPSVQGICVSQALWVTAPLAPGQPSSSWGLTCQPFSGIVLSSPGGFACSCPWACTATDSSQLSTRWCKLRHWARFQTSLDFNYLFTRVYFSLRTQSFSKTETKFYLCVQMPWRQLNMKQTINIY